MLTQLKRPWCWESLKVGGEGDNGGWDGWMASLTQWTWVWVNSRSWWWTGKHGVLQSMGSQKVGNDWATEVNWTEYSTVYMYHFFIHSSVNGHLGCFHVLAIINSAAMDIEVHVFFKYGFFRYMPSSGILGSSGNFIPSFLRNFHTILHSQSLLLMQLQASPSLNLGEPGGSYSSISS